MTTFTKLTELCIIVKQELFKGPYLEAEKELEKLLKILRPFVLASLKSTGDACQEWTAPTCRVISQSELTELPNRGSLSTVEKYKPQLPKPPPSLHTNPGGAQKEVATDISLSPGSRTMEWGVAGSRCTRRLLIWRCNGGMRC